MRVKLAFRWFGENDTIPLAHLAQIPGLSSIVSAVYDVPPGEVWPSARIAALADAARKHGLSFDVVESIPVHEDIKLRCGDVHRLLENYKENIRRVAAHGVTCITYNFMPIFDWTRTTLAKPLHDGSTSLAMEHDVLLHIDPLAEDLTLPGWDVGYTKSEIRSLMAAYAARGEAGLWESLAGFLDSILPVCEACGVRMALHPDDPPYPLFGIPRILGSEQALDRLLSLANSRANALCLCTGSLGCITSNDVLSMVKKYASSNKIAFIHMRNVDVYGDGSFAEAAHPSCCGRIDMYQIAKTLASYEYDGFVRPDHGRMIWGEVGKAGYGLYDRALGLAYLHGLFEATEQERTAHVTQ